MICDVIFDFDGVIADTRDLLFDAFRAYDPTISEEDFLAHFDGNVYETPRVRFTPEGAAQLHGTYCRNLRARHVEAAIGPIGQLAARHRLFIISSGDELVNIDQTPLPHQIRRSNVYRLKTVLKHYHIKADMAHLLDDYEAIVEKLRSYLSTYELIILSGGVSKGKFDFLPKALEELEVEKHFHRIAQRPGKPFWFGSKGKATVFAFPGNPVSSFMCMQQYFKPWLDQSLQLKSEVQPKAVLGTDVNFKPDLTYFLEVKLDYTENGQLIANPVKGNGSGDLANLVDADAFIVLPRGRELFQKGEVHPIIFYR